MGQLFVLTTCQALCWALETQRGAEAALAPEGLRNSRETLLKNSQVSLCGCTLKWRAAMLGSHQRHWVGKAPRQRCLGALEDE